MLQSKHILDPKKGAKVLAKLKVIYDAHMQGRECIHWSKELMSEVETTLGNRQAEVASAKRTGQAEGGAPEKRARGSAAEHLS